MILFGEDALRVAVREFVAHYHGERNHQGINAGIRATIDVPLLQYVR